MLPVVIHMFSIKENLQERGRFCLRTGSPFLFMENKKDRAIAFYIFIFFLIFYFISSSGHFYASDEEVMYFLTKSLATRGSIAIEEERWAGISSAIGREGKVYSISGIGQSLSAIPFYLAGTGIALFFPENKERILIFSVSLLNQFITALICVLIYLILRKFKYSSIASFSTVSFYGISTIAWPYSKYFFNVILTSFFLLLAFSLLCNSYKGPDFKKIILAGFALACSVLVRPETIILLPVFILYIYSRKDSHRMRAVWWFSGPVAIGTLLVLYYNFIRFGNIFEIGYPQDATFSTPVLTGVYGLLFSSGKSIFLYSPVLILSLALLPEFIRRHKNEGILVILLFLFSLFFYARWFNWHGGRCWGPRFLVPSTAFLILPAVQIFDQPLNSKRWPGIFALILFIAGLLIQLSAVLVNYNSYFDIIEEKVNINLNNTFFTPAFSPVFWQGKFLISMFKYNFSRLPDLWIFRIPSGSCVFLIEFLAGTALFLLLRKIHKLCFSS